MAKHKFVRTEIPGWLEGILIFILGGCIVFGILQTAQTLTSGYHFTDDHELIKMEKTFRDGASPGQTIAAHVRNDMRIRYRPLYWVERVTGAYFWGSELLYWNYYTAFKGILTFCFFYWMSRYLKYNRIISALVPCVIMLGNQFTPWFRSSNQESTGLLLAAFTLCLIAAQACYGKYRAWYYNLPIVLGAVLCGLVKESFTLFMPVFIAVKFWLEYWGSERNPEKGRFVQCLKSNIVTYGMIAAAMIFNIGMILFRVGVDKISYAGFDSGTELWVYKQGIKNSLFQYTKSYTYLGILIFLLALMCYRNMDKRNLKKYAGLVFIGGCAMAVQLVAHAKSGMWERYMIPYTVAYVLLFVFTAYRFFEKDRLQRIVFYGILIWFAGSGAKTAYAQSAEYAQDGRNISLLFHEVAVQTQADDDIMCAFYDEELNVASECWLETHGRSAVYSWVNNAFKNEVQLTGSIPEELGIENVDAVLCYEWQKEGMLQLLEIEEAKKCRVYTFGNYILIVK